MFIVIKGVREPGLGEMSGTGADVRKVFRPRTRCGRSCCISTWRARLRKGTATVTVFRNHVPLFPLTVPHGLFGRMPARNAVYALIRAGTHLLIDTSLTL